jgi:hypothetical protein
MLLIAACLLTTGCDAAVGGLGARVGRMDLFLPAGRERQIQIASGNGEIEIERGRFDG